MDKEERASLLHNVDEFCKELRPIEEVCYVEHTFNEQLIPLCRKYNLFGIPVRKEYGGRGADSLMYARALARHSLDMNCQTSVRGLFRM